MQGLADIARHRRHSMPFNSRNKGFKCVSMTWRAMAWQMLLATSWDATKFKERGFKMHVDDTAGKICRGLS